jgi:hypothetical protein
MTVVVDGDPRRLANATREVTNLGDSFFSKRKLKRVLLPELKAIGQCRWRKMFFEEAVETMGIHGHKKKALDAKAFPGKTSSSEITS